jgi:hypothetical protein
MFGRRKTTIPAPSTSIPADGIPFLTAKDLLAPHQPLLKKIRNDAGCTREYFDTYYLPAIERLAEMLQLRPFGHEGEYAKKGGAIEVAIKRVALTLKLRLGTLLPLKCKPEEISHRGECWTYGLFVAALLRDFGGQMLGVKIIGFAKNDKPAGEWHCWKHRIDEYNHYRMKKVAGITRSLSYTTTVLHIRDIIPAEGVQWLYGDPELMDCMLDILAGGHKIPDNPLYSIIVRATSTLRDEISFEAALIEVENSVETREASPPTSEHIDKETGEVIQTTPVKPQQAAKEPAPKQSSHAPVEPIPSNPIDSIPPEMEEPPQNIDDYPPEHDDEITAKNFVARLKVDIQKKRITSEYAKQEGNTIKVKYPTTFRSYTDSPSDLLNELRLIGAIQDEGPIKGISADRVIVLKG